MSSSTSKPSFKLSRSPSQSLQTPQSNSLSSHLAMVELKSRILSSLSKLSDRDTHHIAVEDLEKTIKNLPSPETLPMLLNCLLHDPPSSSDSSPIHRRESLRLMSLLATSHPDAASAHLPKMVSHIAKRLKDPNSDSATRDVCRDAAGALAGLYVKGEDNGVVGLLVRPFLEAAGEQSRGVQAGAAACLARVVECGGANGGAAAAAFGKLSQRVCRLVGGQGVLAKGALLSVFASLAQVGAISPQNMPAVLQSIRECLENSDWATRKAAADTLAALASHSSHLVAGGASSIIAALEACRFDKVKPVRDSMMEALQQWKKMIGKGDKTENPKGGKSYESIGTEENVDNAMTNAGCRRLEFVKDSSTTTSPTGRDSVSKEKCSNIPEKTAVILKRRMPSLTDKELNPEFFHKLETRSSDDMPVEVVVPRRCMQSSHSQGEEEPNMTDHDSVVPSNQNGTIGQESSDSHAHSNVSNHDIEKRLGAYDKMQESDDFIRDKWTEQRGLRARDSKGKTFDADERAEQSQREISATRSSFSRSETEGSFMNKGNWLTIQRQLSQLERQQVNLMNMLQDFMGGSHDSMVTLETRVRGLERVVEEMARDLSLSSSRRGSDFMLGFEGSPGRSSNRYNGLHDYSGPKFGRGVDSRMPFAERYLASDSILSGVRGRDPPRRSDSEACDSYAFTSSRNGLMSSRRGLAAASVDGRSPRTEHEGDQPGSRRAWDKGQGPFRLGEGPSARSVWQASKDEATLEAIRVAGEDNGTSRIATRPMPELDAEALTDGNSGQDRGPLWALWTRAMDALHVGDVDSAYAEVVNSGDDQLLVKLMERSGPVMDQLSNEVASEVLHAVSQFLLEQSLFDIALAWIQQFTELIVEHGIDMGTPSEVKREVILSLNEASAMDPPEDWDGASPDQIMIQLASVWGINIQQLIK